MSDRQNPIGIIIAKALQDEAFKQQLIADPTAFLKAEGVAVPEGVTLKVVADTASVRHLVLPHGTWSAGDHLSDEELFRISGGTKPTEDEPFLPG